MSEPQGTPIPAKLEPQPQQDEIVVVRKVSPMRVENAGLAGVKAKVQVLCVECGQPMLRTPTARPFSDGPHKGGFRCQACWTLYWDEHPELLAKPEDRRAVADQAREIRIKRAGGEGSELLYDDGANRAFLTARGTIVLALKRSPFDGPDEYDPERFQALLRALRGVHEKSVDGYGPLSS